MFFPAYGTRRFYRYLLPQGVCHLSFSPDQKFLLGCGGDRLVYVWDTSTGELVTGKQYSEPSTLGEWTAVKLSGRRTIYDVGWKIDPRGESYRSHIPSLLKSSQELVDRTNFPDR